MDVIVIVDEVSVDGGGRSPTKTTLKTTKKKRSVQGKRETNRRKLQVQARTTAIAHDTSKRHRRRSKEEKLRRHQLANGFQVESAWYASKVPDCWSRSPISRGTTPTVYGYRLVSTLSSSKPAHCNLYFREPLPKTLLHATLSSEDTTYKLSANYHGSISTSSCDSAFKDTGKIFPGLLRDRDTPLSFLVALDRRVHLSSRTLPILLPTLPRILASIERHILTHEFNDTYLKGRGRIPILERALMIQGTRAGQTDQNRGEVVGDALFEVMLVERSVTQLLEELTAGKRLKWKNKWKTVKGDLTNRRMHYGSIATSTQRYIRRTTSATVSEQPRENLGPKDIPDATERIICAVYESTLSTTDGLGWLEGDREAVAMAMTALGTCVQTRDAISRAVKADKLLAVANIVSRPSKSQKIELRKWTEAAKQGLGYEFKDEAWLRVCASALIQPQFNASAGTAIAALGLAVLKILASMYAYFEGTATRLGETPSDIDQTKTAWVRRHNIAKLNARLGLPKLGSARASKSSFFRLLGAAYLESNGDLSKGPADIMRRLLAGQGDRTEEAIELSDSELEQDSDEGHNSDFELLSVRCADYIDLMSSEDEEEGGWWPATAHRG